MPLSLRTLLCALSSPCRFAPCVRNFIPCLHCSCVRACVLCVCVCVCVCVFAMGWRGPDDLRGVVHTQFAELEEAAASARQAKAVLQKSLMAQLQALRDTNTAERVRTGRGGVGGGGDSCFACAGCAGAGGDGAGKGGACTGACAWWSVGGSCAPPDCAGRAATTITHGGGHRRGRVDAGLACVRHT